VSTPPRPSPFGGAFATALAQAGATVAPALQAVGAAGADPHAAAMSLAVSAAKAVVDQALGKGLAAAGRAANVVSEAEAGLRPASDAVAAAAALAPVEGSTTDAASASAAAAAGSAAVASRFSPDTPAGQPGVVCTCETAPAAGNPAVEIVWPPNRGFDGDPAMQSLAPGAKLSRYGGWIDENGQFQDKGSFVAPQDVPYNMRALPPGTDSKPLSSYEVLKTIEQVPSGPAAPWFGEPGGGIQHDLPMSINKLLEGGYIRVIGRVIPG
jgi:hypothetical protein